MNMTKPTKTIFSTMTLCIVIALAGVTSVNASDNDMTYDSEREYKKDQYQGSQHKMKRMAKALSLSEQQKVQIKAIKMQAKDQSKTLRASMKQFKIAEKKLLQTEVFDEQAYRTLHDQYQPNFTQLALIKVKTKHAILNVLTVEQQRKWLKMTKHHQKKDKKERG